MSKFSIDYQSLSKSVEKGSKTYKLTDVKDRLEKVAFDVVRFKDGDPEELWQIQNSDDGDYIVAKYINEEESVIVAAASRNPWEIIINAGDLNVFYKGDPIVKMTASKLGLKVEELGSLKNFLPASLKNDKNLVKSLLKELNNNARQEVLAKYPELS